MKLQMLIAVALTTVLATSSYAAPYDDNDTIEQSSPLQLADNNDNNSMNGMMDNGQTTTPSTNNSNSATDSGTTNGDMNADTATGDDDY